MIKNLDELLKVIDKDIKKEGFTCVPDLSWSFGGLGLMIHRQDSCYSFELLETEPYQRDGIIPMMFLCVGILYISVECNWLYRFLYKRKYGYLPIGIYDKN